MVLMCQPIFDAVAAVEKQDPRETTRILLTPQGRRYDQRLAEQLANNDRLLLIAGHYEGFDERIRLGLSPLEVSIGDYVLSGGESAAMVLVDSVVRLLPGALGDAQSVEEESFSPVVESAASRSGDDDPGKALSFLEYPQYTRPRVYQGHAVPEVLMSGDHGKIKDWRHQQARKRTVQRRPDLL